MAGILRTDTIQNSNTSTIITQTNSTTITIGTTGQTVALASGASSSGFGATYNGAINWDTTPKTTTVTAASGVGYFINTTSGAVTVNLPAGVAGAVVALADYAATWNTNNVTVNANGTDKIGGIASAPATLSTQGQSVTFVYVDSTRGWINVGDATFVRGSPYISATGGTITTCGNYKIHTFTGPGTFTVTNAGAPSGSTTVDYLVVAGGGGGGGQIPGDGSGGAGAGGFRSSITTVPTGAPPLSNPVTMPVSITSYPITVGGGGTGGIACCGSPPSTAANGTPGNNSIFNTITSSGGGAGEGSNRTASPVTVGRGGSGGGAHQGWACQPYPSTVGFPGNFPSVSPPQGNAGGDGQATPNAGGGGGAGATGGIGSTPTSGPGGVGSYVPNSWIGPTAPSYGTPGPVGSTRYFAGGGGGGNSPSRGGQSGSSGGDGGGGAGGSAGTTNTGGGGGGGAPSPSNAGKSGGSGIVIIRYQYQ
jgi:hypothetical protein